MATSSVYTKTKTGNKVVSEALKQIGAIAAGETLSAEDSSDGIEALNDLILSFQAPPNFIMPGLKMWQRETGLLTLTEDQGSYDLKFHTVAFTSGGTYEISPGDTITGATSGATGIVEKITLSSGTWAGGNAAGTLYVHSVSGTFQAENLNVGSNNNVATIAAAPSGADLDVPPPLEIITAVLRHTSSNTDRPLTPMTREEYESLPNKKANGAPSKYYYEKRLDTGKLYFDVEPSSSVASAYKVSFVYRQSIELINDGGDEIDFDVQYYRALKFNLAVELAPEYDRSVSQSLQNLAASSLAMAQTFQPDDVNVYFEPEKDDD